MLERLGNITSQGKFELLAPGGDLNAIKAAIAGGADAVYCGLQQFNARNRAVNLSFEDFCGVIRLAHKNNCQIFLTLNIIILESEIPTLVKLLNRLVNTGVDGIIVQDIGLFYLLSKYFPSLDVHASTQCTTHNSGQIKFLKKLAATRVNLSRELNVHEIKELSPIAHEQKMLVEVFVHGSYCIAFSGLCYMGSIQGGKSGNRGRCNQPCRDQYQTTVAGKNYPLNLKDNSAFYDLSILANVGVDALKIEGRIKKFHYVYTVVNCWKKQLLSFYMHNDQASDDRDLYRVFNRDFSNSYLLGDISRDMFIDNPLDNSIQYLAGLRNIPENIKEYPQELYDEKKESITIAEEKIKNLEIDRIPVAVCISGKLDSPLKMSIRTEDVCFELSSTSQLASTSNHILGRSTIEKRFKALKTADFYIEELNLSNLDAELFIPFSELSELAKNAAAQLNGLPGHIAPVELPKPITRQALQVNPTLAVLISHPEDLDLLEATSAEIYYKLPDCLSGKCAQYVDLFQANKKLIPWFPSILIGDDYKAAVEFLQLLQPQMIVTNNTGIAYVAAKNGINWIAGPYLNATNSFTLRALKELYNCCGVFISNELNKKQISKLDAPENFSLHYSIYHPILLMASRQCLHNQISGCTKKTVDDECLQDCSKSDVLTNMEGKSFHVSKKAGDYHTMYNGHNFLNLDIIQDLPDTFSRVLVDLRNIDTETNMECSKACFIGLVEDVLAGDASSANQLRELVKPVTSEQYLMGL